jgi:hypothetical protein
MQDFFQKSFAIRKLPCCSCGAWERDCTSPRERASPHVQQHVQVQHRGGGHRPRDVGVIQTPATATPRASRRSTQRSAIRAVRGQVAGRSCCLTWCPKRSIFVRRSSEPERERLIDSVSNARRLDARGKMTAREALR